MKFLCPNCKAKYQIADEKIGGRTLKMDCRKCGHSIVIRADGTEDSNASSPPAQSLHGVSMHGVSMQGVSMQGVSMHGVSMQGASQPAEAPRSWPSAPLSRAASTPSQPRLSARTSTSHVGQNPAGTSSSRLPARPSSRSIHPGSARPVVLEQWHVAINDVPVGPMKRDEIARKIAQGAVRGESLAWREGFDDWRPLRDIPELSSLLRESLPPNRSAPPPPPRAVSMNTGAHASVSRVSSPVMSTSSPHQMALVASAADSDAEEPTMLAGMNFGMNFGANALAPMRISDAPPVQDEEDGLPPLVGSIAPGHASSDSLRVSGEISLRTPSAAPKAPFAPLQAPSEAAAANATAVSAPIVPSVAPRSGSESNAKPKKQQVQISVPLMFLMVTLIPFSMALAWRLGDHLFRSDNAHAQAVVPTAPVVAAPIPPRPPTREVVPSLELAAVAPTNPLPTAETVAETPTPNTTAAQRNRRGGATTPEPTTTAVAAANPAFDRFRDQGGGGPARLATQVADHNSEGPSHSGAELTADQINTVVRREQRNLQSCYLIELRRAGGSSETIRVNMSLTIGSSGAVTAARAQGPSFGNLSECLERSVRRWRFPASAEGGETAFPLVLSPGA